MSDFPTKKITIYHKLKDIYERYVVEASIRHTHNLNHNKNGFNSVDSVLIRIFDVDNKDIKYYVTNGDIIVENEVSDTIEGTTPQTQLNEKYGKDKVFKVNSTEYLDFNDEALKELNHTKLGCI